MTEYTLRENTPLKYHKFFWYVGLPLGFVQNLCNLIVYDYSYPQIIMVPEVSFIVLETVFQACCFYGFFKWTPYSWYSAMCYWGCSSLYWLYILSLSWLYIPWYLPEALGYFLGVFSVSVLSARYYMKRRRLFFPPDSPFLADPPASVGPGPTDGSYIPESPAALQRRFCHHCGKEVPLDSAFCHFCGTKLEKL